MIRGFTWKDIERIMDIEAESFPKSAFGQFDFYYIWKELPNAFLVYEDAEILGYILFDEYNGHIISLAVATAHRRRGIGGALVRKVLETCKQALVEVRESNYAAQAFYRSLGFVKRGIIPGYYGDEDALVMAVVLPAEEI
jgi:ribosomal-protein-alanine N-acetyltransferase